MIKKCDVLYIHPSKNPIGEDYLRYAFVPMGLVGILNRLKSRNIEVVGLNFAVEKTVDPNFDISTALQSIDYKVLLIDLHWYEHSFGAMYVAEQSKRLFPERSTIIGGYTTTIYAPEILENFSFVDYAVTGDSELPVEKLVNFILKREMCSLSQIPNLYYRQDGAVKVSDRTWVQTTLDDIDCVNTDMFLHEDFFPHLSCTGASQKFRQQFVCVARGCKYNCIYCCGANKNMNALFGRCDILLRSAEKLASDFIRVYEKGISHVSPSHDMQMFGRKYYKELFLHIRRYGVKGGLYLECFQLPTKEYIDDIAATFEPKKTVLVISPISGNEELRRKNGKMFSNDALYDIVEYIVSKGINVQLYYTMNLIGETRDQFYDSYFQFKFFHDFYGMGKKHIFYQKVVIDPLAGMRDMDGVEVELNSFMDYYRYCQIPTNNFDVTGFKIDTDVSYEEKIQLFDSIMV